MQIPHNQEVFSNKFGTIKAVVCSCGFATTYTVMTNDADVMGMRHFKVSHEAHLSRLEAERFNPLGDNHHNAAKCPYCNPEYERIARLEAQNAKLREALEKIEDKADGYADDSEDGLRGLRFRELSKQARAERTQMNADMQIPEDKPRPKCPDCNSVGMSHCSDPANCGGVYWPDHMYRSLEAQNAKLIERIAEMRTYSHETVKGLVDWRDKRIAELEAQNAKLEERLLIWESDGAFLIKAADKMAAVCDDWVKRKLINERSALADARLEYCDPYTFGEPKIRAALQQAKESK